MSFTIAQKLLAKKAAKDFGINDISKFSYGKLNDFNDAYYWTLINVLENRSIKKVAYPNYGGEIELQPEYDMDKWLNIVYAIYLESKKTSEPVLSLLEKYADTLDKESQEDTNFKSWFKFFYFGENLKYSLRNDTMKKQALYGGGLGQTSGLYGQSTYDLPGSSFSSAITKAEDDSMEKIDPSASDSEKLKAWKQRVNTACRRIDKLLRESDHLSPDEFLELSQLLLTFSHKIRGVTLVTTAQDLTFQFANSLKKYSKNKKSEVLIKNASELLFKTAQDATTPTPTDAPAAPAAPAAGEATGEGTPAAPAAPVSPLDALKAKIPGPDDVEPASLENIKPIPGPKEGEYDEFVGDIKVDDAASKLDEVAGMLSDRRIIRLLAEFDIMLDKIGIAAMFPELAEAQSKLIDGYSYALTRVTKMMGQLANARMLLQAQDGGEVLSAEQAVDAEPDVPTREESEQEETPQE
jgi:hypothetical protein